MQEREHRQYQDDIHNSVITAFQKRYRRILVQSPTGSGKSVNFARFISGANTKGKNVLFLVHRRELVKQAAGHMDVEEVVYGIIMAGSAASIFSRVQLASISTLRSRAMGERTQIDMPDADLVIIDEAHNANSKTYKNVINHYSDLGALIIGFTATPVGANGKGLGKQFDYLVLGPKVRLLMDEGYLAEASYMVPNIPDLNDVPEQGGDWVEEKLSKIMNNAKLIGDIVDHWVKYANNRQTVAFAVRVAHSRAIVEKFNARGISAAHIDGRTPTKERDLILEKFEAGKFKILSNCQVFVEGTDMPEVSVIIMACPTKSLRKYLQMGGRGLRPKWDGGDCLIMDHTGNVLRHGKLDEEHDWSLVDNGTIQERDAANKSNEKSGQENEFICSHCGNLFKRQSICPKCGTPLAQSTKDVATARGELVELPKEKKKKKEKYNGEQKLEWYSMFATHAKAKDYNPGWAFHKYKEKFKEPPLKTMAAFHKDPTKEFNGYLTYLNIKSARSKQKYG